MVINGALREIVNKFFLKSFDTNFIGNIKSHQRNNFFYILVFQCIIFGSNKILRYWKKSYQIENFLATIFHFLMRYIRINPKNSTILLIRELSISCWTLWIENKMLQIWESKSFIKRSWWGKECEWKIPFIVLEPVHSFGASSKNGQVNC